MFCVSWPWHWVILDFGTKPILDSSSAHCHISSTAHSSYPVLDDLTQSALSVPHLVHTSKSHQWSHLTCLLLLECTSCTTQCAITCHSLSNHSITHSFPANHAQPSSKSTQNQTYHPPSIYRNLTVTWHLHHFIDRVQNRVELVLGKHYFCIFN